MNEVPEPQGNRNFRTAAGGLVLVSAALIATTYREEGTRYVPYYDTVGVKTVCQGSTKNVEDRVYTKEECNARTVNQLTEHGSGILKCIHVDIAQSEYEAYADFADNVGIHAFCTSTLLKLLNQQKYEAACKQLLRWVKQPELAGRRQREYEKCMTPVDTKKEVPNVVVTKVARSEDMGSVAVNRTADFWEWLNTRPEPGSEVGKGSAGKSATGS